MKSERTSGFTLIEVIVTIVIMAIALAAALPLLDRVFLQSHEPRVLLHGGLDLYATMEDLVAWHTNSLEDLRGYVGSEGGAYPVDTRFVVVDNHYVAFPGNLESATVASNNLLKVTLQAASGERLTRIFTEPL